MNIIIALKLASRLDTFPGRCNLDQDTVFFDTDGLVKSDELLCLKTKDEDDKIIPRTNSCRTLAFVASLSKERRASTSVETRPGTIARISLPNSTSW